MHNWVTYLLGLTLVAIAALGAYHVYSLTTAQSDCASATPTGGSYSGRHAPLRA